MGARGAMMPAVCGALACIAAACSEGRPLATQTPDAVLASDSCRACHGSPQSPAPPRDLQGNFDTSAIGVGAHQAHLTGAHSLTTPIACDECHRVPTELHSPGHLDHPLPAQVTFGQLAVADGAAPTWSHSRATCSATYCHGNGMALSRDTTPNLVRAPVWTAGGSQLFCGSCHGIPPRDATHSLNIDIGDCYRCHAGTVDPAGNIIFSGPARTSLHINGVVDVQSP